MLRRRGPPDLVDRRVHIRGGPVHIIGEAVDDEANATHTVPEGGLGVVLRMALRVVTRVALRVVLSVVLSVVTRVVTSMVSRVVLRVVMAVVFPSVRFVGQLFKVGRVGV